MLEGCSGGRSFLWLGLGLQGAVGWGEPMGPVHVYEESPGEHRWPGELWQVQVYGHPNASYWQTHGALVLGVFPSLLLTENLNLP